MQGFSEESIELIMASWRESTRSEYSTYISKWFEFCSARDYNPLSVPLTIIADFLTLMYMEGKSYSTINIARSALSALGLKQDGVSVGSHPTIVKILKGMFNLRPTRARPENTWDVNKVIIYLRDLPTLKDIGIKDLTMKLTMLLALTIAARPQTIHLITTEGMKKLYPFLGQITKPNQMHYRFSTTSFDFLLI